MLSSPHDSPFILALCVYKIFAIWQALNPLSIHVTFTAIFPEAYPGEAKMCLRLSWRSQMPIPAKCNTTYRRDSPEVAKLWLRLVFMQLTCDPFAIAKFLFYSVTGYASVTIWTWLYQSRSPALVSRSTYFPFSYFTYILLTVWSFIIYSYWLFSICVVK